jgi:hypothetical protein
MQETKTSEGQIYTDMEELQSGSMSLDNFKSISNLKKTKSKSANDEGSGIDSDSNSGDKKKRKLYKNYDYNFTNGNVFNGDIGMVNFSTDGCPPKPSILKRRNKDELNIECKSSSGTGVLSSSILSNVSNQSMHSLFGIPSGILESPNNTFLSDISIYGIGGITGTSTLSNDTPSRFEYLSKFDFEFVSNSFLDNNAFSTSPISWDSNRPNDDCILPICMDSAIQEYPDMNEKETAQ